MKNRFTFIAGALLLVFGFMAAPAKAQNGAFAPYANIGISASGTNSVLTSSTPQGNAGFGIESSTKHLLLDTNYQASFANSFSTASGYTSTVSVSGYLKVKGFLLGGGGFYSNELIGVPTTTGNLESGFVTTIKSITAAQIRPYIGGGYQFSYDRILVNYVLPGSGPSQVQGSQFLGHNEIFLGKTGIRKHIRFVQDLNYISNTTGESWTGGGGLKFIL